MEDSTNVLNNLIQVSIDGEEGFKLAAEYIKDPALKASFLERAEGCRQAADELKKHITGADEEPVESGSMMAMVNRGWINFKAMITDYDDKAIIAECVSAEESAKASYEEALKSDLPPELHTVVQHQYDGLLKNYAYVSNLSKE